MDGVADTPEKMDRYIRTIYNKANEMNTLINELTFYTKIDIQTASHIISRRFGSTIISTTVPRIFHLIFKTRVWNSVILIM